MAQLAPITATATTTIITVASALISGVTPRRTFNFDMYSERDRPAFTAICLDLIALATLPSEVSKIHYILQFQLSIC